MPIGHDSKTSANQQTPLRGRRQHDTETNLLGEFTIFPRNAFFAATSRPGRRPAAVSATTRGCAPSYQSRAPPRASKKRNKAKSHPKPSPSYPPTRPSSTPHPVTGRRGALPGDAPRSPSRAPRRAPARARRGTRPLRRGRRRPSGGKRKRAAARPFARTRSAGATSSPACACSARWSSASTGSTAAAGPRARLRRRRRGVRRLAELVADGVDGADLRKLFEVGEVVPCVVPPTTDGGAAGGAAHAPPLHRPGPSWWARETLAGVPVWASVRSRESHGADAHRWQSRRLPRRRGAQLKRWRAHLCVAKPTRGGAPLQLVRFGGGARRRRCRTALPRLGVCGRRSWVRRWRRRCWRGLAASASTLRARSRRSRSAAPSATGSARPSAAAPRLSRGCVKQPELKRLGLSLAPHLVACAPQAPAAGTRRAASTR